MRYWSTPGCLLTTLPSCTNFEEEEALLKPAMNSPSLGADFALKHSHQFCSNNRCQKHPPGPSNSRAWLPTHHLSLCSAFPGWSHADSCLSLGAAGGLPPASLQWGALPGGRQHNQQLRAKLHRQEVKPGLLSSLV